MTTEKLVNIALFGKTQLANQKVELATIKDIFEIVKKSKSIVNAINTDMGSASSKVGSAFKQYDVAKKEINDTISKIKEIDANLLNSDEGKKIQRWLSEVDSDLSTLKDLQSNISKIGSLVSKFNI
jgi:DNA repair ATPase RecN